MDALVGPAVEVVKCVIPPFLRQIGYCIHYKKTVEKLRRRAEDLNNSRTELQRRVDEAENNLESIKKSVVDWFKTVDKETTQDEIMLLLLNDEDTFEIINQQCCKGWCCCRARWNIGRDAAKKIVIVDELLNQGKSFFGNNVSDPSPPVGTEFIPTNEGFEDFASRKSSEKKIMAALKDDKTNLVGVYGMGGVGKTMLVNQIYKLAMEEKIFDAVAMTTVSEKVDLKVIQSEIANQLGLKRLNDTDNINTRAAMLRKRLTKLNKKFLVILDDMWTTELGLTDVGIPYGEACCKVIITTKSLDVCNSLRSQKNIEVKVLSEKESWYLFKKNVGEDVVNSDPDLQTVARDIARECGNLPIALVTLGRALINKDKHVWIDTANQLENSDFSSLGEIKSKVFKSIKLSYDHLGNEILKKCLLVCCSFPEDYRISLDELMIHVMGDHEILRNMPTMKQARGRLHTILDKLIASCLLLGHKENNNGGIANVWMHDIVRYVALSIASEEGTGFYIEAGTGLKDWPASRKLLSRSNPSKCLRLSLMRNEISVLPEQLELPHLLSLSLEGNKLLKKIPVGFFQKMEALAILNLRKTGISSLPSSLSCLVNLHTLQLDYCVFDHSIDVSVIGNLSNLEILSLQHCGLSMLPKEIGGLLYLKYLNLSNNDGLDSVPPSVISSLSRLEELHMTESFCKWEVEGMEKNASSSNASLNEVASLTCLNSVYLDLRNEGIMFSISIDHAPKKRTIRYCNSEAFSCFLMASSPLCYSIKVLLQRVDSLILRSCAQLKSVGELVVGAGFNNMKSLSVRRCDEMEYVMSVVEEEIPRTALVALEKLHLHSLGKLKEIFHGLVPVGFLDKLKVLRINKCNEIVSVISPNLLAKLKSLEVLRVEKCCKVNEVFSSEEQTVGRKGHGVNVNFPSLREIYLQELPELRNIISKGVCPLESFQFVKVMEVTACDSLKYLFSPSMARSLGQLEKLKVDRCRGMVAVITTSDEMEMELEAGQVLLSHHHDTTTTTTSSTTNTSPQPPILPNLRQLKIRDCDSLKHLINEDFPSAVIGHELRKIHLSSLPNFVTSPEGIIPMNNGSHFENLEELTVSYCNRVKHLLHGGLPQLKELDVSCCNSLEEITIISDDQQKLHRHVLPQLTKLGLLDLPNLIIVVRGLGGISTPSSFIGDGSLRNLKSLSVARCDSLKHLLPMRLLLHGDLSKLESLDINECKNLEVLFIDDDDQVVISQDNHVKISEVLPRLIELSIYDLPKFSGFHKGSSVLDWPSLKELKKRRLKVIGRHDDILKTLGYPYRNYIDPVDVAAVIRNKIRVHAQVIRVAYLFREAGGPRSNLRFSYPLQDRELQVMLPDANDEEDEEQEENEGKGEGEEEEEEEEEDEDDDDDDDDEDEVEDKEEEEDEESG